jgi:hypothetical protein
MLIVKYKYFDLWVLVFSSILKKKKGTVTKRIPCCRPQERRMVSDGLTLARNLHCNFLCVLCEEPGTPIDEKQTRFQLGSDNTGVRCVADNMLPLSRLEGKSDKKRNKMTRILETLTWMLLIYKNRFGESCGV